MACVALTSLMATIKLQFLQPNNPSRVPLDDEGMESLYEKLSSLQAFVQEKSGARGGTAIRDLEMKIRDFALDTEDCIEIQLSNFLLAKNGEDQQKAAQKLHQTLREAAENAAELLEKSKETDDEKVVNESEGALMIPWLKHASASEPSNVVMVGRLRDHVLIMNKLIWGSEKLEVVSIVGMAGIGKTTLISSVYQDPDVESHFDVRRWVSMPVAGGYNNVSQLLYTLLWTVLAEAEDNEIEKGSIPDDDDLAAEQVYKCLKGKRYLIVLDNLWNNRAWYDISGCFPDDNNGSRIVITTMHFRRDSSHYNDGYVHNMTLLNPKESWNLFSWALFGDNPFPEHQKIRAPPEFLEIRSQVVETCEGLPYSIVVVSKRLSMCDNIRKEWKKVQKEIELLGVLDRRALIHTYNQLPQHLKVCFLYFGVFPKRSAIKVKLLLRLWIVEGFINPLEGKELESQAYEYLQEFIDRTLILIDNWSSSGKVKNCRMHSALHSFCVREAQKEGIFCALNTLQLPRGSFSMFANSCRWLSFYTHKFDYYVLLRTNNPRSIFFFQEDAEIYVSFKLLRVLAFVSSSFLQRVPTRLHDLVFLRYLSVTEWFEGLDYIVSTNQNLQTLVVSSKESQLGTPTIHLPSTIWESPQLQHLELDKSYVIDPPSMDKDNMQTLSWVCPTHCRTGVYCRFPNIKNLEVFVFGSNHPIILDNLECLEGLERLTISVLFNHVLTLPKPSLFPSKLKKLRLNGINLSERDLTVIGMLPQLEVLKLVNATFDGKVWEVEKGGFCQLKFLLLENKMLEQWMVGDGSFPRLKHLVLRFCCCLEKLPVVMEDIHTLESIELEQCCPSIITSARCIIESQRDAGNNILEIKINGENIFLIRDKLSRLHTLRVRL
ncbi:PREDICTED: putative late blight resistance protein homolog R1A-10 [Ipomoea nil]|uniref:putative late blight resistance protein homolog R1A-10 n=1 Tax=Ipomoea nil TaxID=35883 RepID=UPI00090147CF|nr:PREDICTED: putative late blight resistance protein homolog R1A-10 [Ipomoea nil]